MHSISFPTKAGAQAGSIWPAAFFVALMSVAALLWQASVPTNSDVSWLIDLADRVLSGDRLYVDLIESNPPVAVFIYMPAVLVGRATGLSAEFSEVLLVVMASLASLAAGAFVLARCGLNAGLSRFVVAGAFALLIMPRYAFAEREHVALILMLPMILLLFARQQAVTMPLVFALAVGLAGGLGAAIKPHFALLVLLPALRAVLLQRSLRPILCAPELFVAAAVTIGFALLTLIAFPAYLADIVPMEAETYLWVRLPVYLDPKMQILAVATLAGFLILGRDRLGDLLRLLLMSAAGAIVIFVIQGKGWSYQLYPALALVVIVYFIGVLPGIPAAIAKLRTGSRMEKGVALAPLIVMAVVALLTPMCRETYPLALPLAPSIRAISDHPRIFALSEDIGIGHPLTRSVNGVWVSRVCSQLIQASAAVRRDEPGASAELRERMEHWIAWERAEIQRSLLTRPDVVVLDHQTFSLAALVRDRPDIAALLDGYRKTESVGTVDLFVRRDLLAASRQHGQPT